MPNDEMCGTRFNFDFDAISV